MFARAVNYFDLFESYTHAWSACHIFQIALNYSAVYLQINKIARPADKPTHSAANLLQISTKLTAGNSPATRDWKHWIYCFVRPKMRAIKSYKATECLSATFVKELAEEQRHR